MSTPGRLRRHLFVAVGIAIVLVAAGAVALKLVLTPERLRAEVREATAEATGLDARLDAATLSLLPFGVSIAGLTIPGESPGDPDFLSLESALVHLDLTDLLRRVVVVERIAVESPRVALRQVDGVVVLPGRLGAAPPPAPTGDAGAAGTKAPARRSPAAALGLSAAVERIEISNGSFHLVTPGGAEDVRLDGITLAGSLEIEPGKRRARSRGELSLAGLDLAALAAWRETLDSLEPVLRFDLGWDGANARLALEELRLVAAPLDLPFTGSIDGLPASPRIDLSLPPTPFELSELLPLVPPAALPDGRRPRARGPVRLAVHVTGALGVPETPPDVAVRLDFEGAEFAMADFPIGLVDLRGGVTAGATGVAFEGFTARLGEGRLAVHGRVDSVDVPERTRFDLAVEADLDLADVTRSGLAPEGVETTGHLRADVRARGATADPTTTALEGTLRLERGGVTTPELPVPVTGLEGEVELAGRDAILRRLEGRLGRTSFRGEGRVVDALGTPRVELTGRVPRLDLVELAPPPEAGAAGGGPATGGGADSLPPLVPPLPPIAADLTITIDSLLTAGGPATDAVLTAALRDGRADVVAQLARADFDGVVMTGFDGRVEVADGVMQGGFTAPRVAAHRVPLTDVRGAVRLTNDRLLAITDVTAAVWTGRVKGDARIDLTEPGAPAFVIETSATDVQANDFVSALTPADGFLHGKLDLTSRFEGKGSVAEAIAKTLTGNGDVDVTGGRLERTPAINALWSALSLDEREAIDFRDLATSFRVESGRIVTDDVKLVGTEADWRISGATAFDGKIDYRVQAELSEALSATYRKRVGSDLAALLAGTSGRLVLDLEVTGTAKKPKVRLDVAKLTARARDNAVDALGDKLKEGLGKGLQGLLGGGAPEPAAADSSDTTKAAAEKPSIEDALKKLLGGRK